MKRLLFAFLIAIPSTAYANYLGETFICHFGKYGKVIIDTREPGGSITVHGQKYPAQGGADFYQTDDGKIAILFGPRMRFWDYNDVRDDHCKRRKNLGRRVLRFSAPYSSGG